MRRALLFVALIACHPTATPAHKFAAGINDAGTVTPPKAIVRHLDSMDGGANGCFPAIARHFDAAFVPDGGIPAPATYSAPGFGNGLASPAFGQPTLHETAPRPHCVIEGRFELPLNTADAIEWDVLVAKCGTDAGSQVPACACILAAPALVATLDATWSAQLDGGACWWESDGGAAPSPPDLYPGSTP